MTILEIMTTTKTEFVKTVLKLVSEEFDVEFQDMFNYVRLCICLTDDERFDMCESNAGAGQNNTCHAHVKKPDGTVSQCTRGKVNGCFCAMHDRHHKEGRLKHGYIKTKDESKSNNKSIRKLEKLSLTSGQLFYDPMTGKIYYSPEDNREEVNEVYV